MELSTIKTKTTWSEAVNEINSNNQKIAVALRNVSEKNRGYFTTYEKLILLVPKGNIGDIAFVGSSYPFAVYEWNGTAWSETGLTGGEKVNLNDYVPLKGNSSIDGNIALTGGIGINRTLTVINNGTITTAAGIVISRATQQSVILSDGTIKPISEMGNLRASTIENTTDYDDVF